MRNLNVEELESINAGGEVYDAVSKAFWIAKGSIEVSVGGAAMVAGVVTADPLLVYGGAATFSDGALDIGTNW